MRMTGEDVGIGKKTSKGSGRGGVVVPAAVFVSFLGLRERWRREREDRGGCERALLG